MIPMSLRIEPFPLWFSNLHHAAQEFGSDQLEHRPSSGFVQRQNKDAKRK
jgi:hypothetical protein